MATLNNNIPFVPENTMDPAAGLNESLKIIDMLVQISVVNVGLTTPPGSPVEGNRYIVGAGATGLWSGKGAKLAQWIDSAWLFGDAFIVLNQTDGKIWVKRSGTWGTLITADTGWTAGTGTPSKGAFATGSATATQVAERLLAIEQALTTLGILSA